MSMIKATTLTFAFSLWLVAFTVAQNTCQPLISSGLMVYYPFCGNANDESGNNLNGTNYGSTLTTDRFGNADKAYSFNGVSEYIRIPEITNSGIGSFSISLWLLNLKNEMGMLAFYHGAASGEWGIYNNGMGVHLSDGTWYSDNVGLLDSAWTHLVGIYSKGNYIKVYLNGQLAGQTAIPNQDLIVFGGYYSNIGAYNNGVTNFWHGKIDDIAIYDRELTPAEIEALFHEGGWMGVNQISGSPFTIYPNRTSGRFVVSLPDGFHQNKIQVLNTMGTVVYSTGYINSKTEIDLSIHSKGIYLVHLTNGANNWTEKVIVE